MDVSERAIIDALPRAIVVTDGAGMIELWNREAERLYGWSASEVLGRSVLDVLAPPDELAQNATDLGAVAGGAQLSGDRNVVCRDGRTVRVLTFTRPILDTAGKVIAIVGASEDVGSVREAEQNSRDVAAHFQLSLRAGGLGTWRWDIATGETVWDARLEALFGLPPGGFDGTFETYTSLLHPDDREAVLQVVHDAVQTRTGYRVEHRVMWPDGSVHWLSGAGDVVIGEQGAVTGTVGCVSDATDRVQQELDRQRAGELAMAMADSERIQRQRLEFLNVINDALNESSTMDEIMRNVTRAAVPRLGDWCSIHVLPSKGAAPPDVEIAHVDPKMIEYARELQARFPYDPDAPSGVPYVIRTGESVFYPDITNDDLTTLDASDEERRIVEELALRSVIAVPLSKRGRIIGAMQFVMSESSRRYTGDDVALAQAVAGRIASGIENQRLNEQQRVIAHTLQRSLLPTALPDIPGIEVAVRYWPAGEAMEVGGDFYDVFPLDRPGCWAVVIGDVCGTGPSAAALTGLARHSIRASAWHGDDPSGVLSAVNRAVQRSGADTFLTALYAVVDTNGSNPTITVCSGGHPLSIHARDGRTSTIGQPGTLLGLFPEPTFNPVTTELASGDVVVFHTDGATDLPSPHALTPSQICDLVGNAAATGQTTEGIADRIQDALELVLPFEHRDDDVAILVMRVIGRE